MEDPKALLHVPATFIRTAKEFPEKVDRALALLDTAEGVSELLAKTDTYEHYARRIKVDTETINNIQYGKLKIIAKLGQLMAPASPQERGAKGGRGNKAPQPPGGALSHTTVASYRKVADNADAIDEYRDAVAEDGEAEMSTAGFIRFVASDGNLKAHQNKGVVEWYTPSDYVESARIVMGSIDLDPASSAQAQEVVKAEKFYTKDQDGLDAAWEGNVFLNPPFKADLIKKFVTKLCNAHATRQVQQAVLLTNNNTDTYWWHEAVNECSRVCFTRGRIAFYSPVGDEASPTNGHTLFYFGDKRSLFSKEFAKFGVILEAAT